MFNIEKAQIHALHYFEQSSCGSGSFTYVEFVEWSPVLMSKLHSPVLGILLSMATKLLERVFSQRRDLG